MLILLFALISIAVPSSTMLFLHKPMCGHSSEELEMPDEDTNLGLPC